MVKGRKERRKYNRIRMKNPAFLTSAKKFGQIFDLSLEGLSFTHEGPAAWPREMREITFLFTELIQIRSLPVEIIWDGEEPSLLGAHPGRRCGVRFENISLHQVYKLEYLLWSQTEGWADLPSPDDLIRLS